jgi:hypothetical protein
MYKKGQDWITTTWLSRWSENQQVNHQIVNPHCKVFCYRKIVIQQWITTTWYSHGRAQVESFFFLSTKLLSFKIFMKSPLSIYEELATPPIFMVEYWTFQFQRRWWRHVYFPLSVGFWREQEEARGQLFYKIAEKKVVGCEVKRNKK